MLEKLKNSNKIDNPVDDKLLNDAINEYEKLLSYLVNIDIISKEQYNIRWAFVDLTEYDVDDNYWFYILFSTIIRLGELNMFSYIDPLLMALKIRGKHRIYNITNYLGQIYGIEMQNTVSLQAGTIDVDACIYGTYTDFIPRTFNNDIYINILKSDTVSEEDKNILRAIESIFNNNKEFFNKDRPISILTIKDFISFFYSYFRLNNMTTSHYTEVMSFINKVNNDLEYLDNKLDILRLKSFEDLLNIFMLYYNEPAKERRVIK